MNTCNFCSKCCHYIKDGKLKTCKHLVKLSNTKKLCRIYGNRIGTMIDEDVMCKLRKDSQFDYANCPLNTNKPMFPEIK